MKLNRKRRLYTIAIIIVGVSCAVALTLYALQQNINLYYTPTQLQQQLSVNKALHDRMIRLGGMVAKNSVQREPGDLKVSFVMTDFKNNVQVQYQGVLPTLFREGQGVVAQGKLDASGVFMAKEILAKHDENYMPPGIKKS